MTDLVTFGETMLRLSPPRGKRLETTASLDVTVSGAESNVAATASNLGVDAVWLSKLPDTPLGRRVVRGLRGHGVRVGVSWTDGGRVGTYYLEHGRRPRETTAVYDRRDSAVTTAEPADLPLAIVRDADTFYVSGVTPALSPTLRQTTAAVLNLAAESGTRTVFGLHYRPNLWDPEEARSVYESLFPSVDVLVVAERDTERVLGREGPAVERANGLAAAYDFDTVVMTRGEHGALALHGGEVHEEDVVDAETCDGVGSEDAFVGGFLAERHHGGSVAEALECGTATAALDRTVDGDAAVVSRDEVASVIESEDRDAG
jgi:2-dehydro-3-deoxygluconokinase